MTADVLVSIEPALKVRLARYAAIAAFFRGNLPRSLNRDAGIITAQFLAAFVHEEQQNKRLGVTRLKLGPFVESDRGQGGHMPQLHSGKQLRSALAGTDIDGAPADVSDATASSADTNQLEARVERNAAGDGVDLVVTDVPNSNLGPVQVTVAAGPATITETFEVIAGDAVALNLGAFTEEDRPV